MKWMAQVVNTWRTVDINHLGLSNRFVFFVSTWWNSEKGKVIYISTVSGKTMSHLKKEGENTAMQKIVKNIEKARLFFF